jgi:hypothetical protein
MDLGALSNLLIGAGSPHKYLVQDLGEPTVYHYTDLGALQSIVTGHDLWLTNARFSNDYEEGTHGRKIARAAIDEFVKDGTRKKDERDFARSVAQEFKASALEDVFVCCFCRKDDLLRQWRSYGSNATVVSIAVATAGFQKVSGSDMPSKVGLMYLWRVFYGEKKQRNIVKDCIRFACREQSLNLSLNCVELAIDALRFFIPTFKNSAFQDEQEARLVFRPAPGCGVKPEFRVSRGMLVPYYSLKKLAAKLGNHAWSPPITSVRIGPNPNQEINREGVKLMLRTKGYAKASVEVSEAPYRG